MTDRLGIILACFIVGLILFDVLVNGSSNLLFLGRKMMDLLEWMAFWR